MFSFSLVEMLKFSSKIPHLLISKILKSEYFSQAVAFWNVEISSIKLKTINNSFINKKI